MKKHKNNLWINSRYFRFQSVYVTFQWSFCIVGNQKNTNKPAVEGADNNKIQIDENLRELFRMSDIDFDSLDAKQQKELMAWAGKRKNQKQLEKISVGEL